MREQRAFREMSEPLRRVRNSRDEKTGARTPRSPSHLWKFLSTPNAAYEMVGDEDTFTEAPWRQEQTSHTQCLEMIETTRSAKITTKPLQHPCPNPRERRPELDNPQQLQRSRFSVCAHLTRCPFDLSSDVSLTWTALAQKQTRRSSKTTPSESPRWYGLKQKSRSSWTTENLQASA